MKYKVANALTERHKDENGYLYVDKSPILRAGILEYYGSELLPEGADNVDGVKVDPDKIYKVYIPEEEIRKGAETFKMIPITDDHTWLGDDGEDAKDYQVGMTGENVYVEDGFLYVPLKFTGKDIVDEVESHEKEELSSSYYNRFEKSKNSEYDFIARDIKGNHLALVDKGRCGSAVRVLNSKIGVNQMAVKAKIANEAILKLDGKEINLDQFFEEEADEREEGGEEIHDDSISENEDKREIIREIMAVAGKADADFEGGEDEKVRTIAELAEKLAYKPSEESESDNACSKNEDEKEEEKKDEEEKEEDKEEDKGAKSMNYDVLYAKISNALKAEQAKAEADKVKAYNSVHSIIGDFNPFGMSDKDMYVKALNHLGVELDGSENVAELSAMLKACSAVRSKVDNGFSYESAGSEEVEFNI
jgi:hypothetical protein